MPLLAGEHSRRALLLPRQGRSPDESQLLWHGAGTSDEAGPVVLRRQGETRGIGRQAVVLRNSSGGQRNGVAPCDDKRGHNIECVG